MGAVSEVAATCQSRRILLYALGGEVFALEEQGDVELLRQRIGDAIAQIEAGGRVDALAVAHIDGLGRIGLIGVKRHDLSVDRIENLSEVTEIVRAAARTSDEHGLV